MEGIIYSAHKGDVPKNHPAVKPEGTPTPERPGCACGRGKVDADGKCAKCLNEEREAKKKK